MAHKRSEVPELEKMLQYGRKKKGSSVKMITKAIWMQVDITHFDSG